MMKKLAKKFLGIGEPAKSGGGLLQGAAKAMVERPQRIEGAVARAKSGKPRRRKKKKMDGSGPGPQRIEGAVARAKSGKPRRRKKKKMDGSGPDK